eukprot:6866609-Karenia_brevis.AAC.1
MMYDFKYCQNRSLHLPMHLPPVHLLPVNLPPATCPPATCPPATCPPTTCPYAYLLFLSGVAGCWRSL